MEQEGMDANGAGGRMGQMRWIMNTKYAELITSSRSTQQYNHTYQLCLAIFVTETSCLARGMIYVSYMHMKRCKFWNEYETANPKMNIEICTYMLCVANQSLQTCIQLAYNSYKQLFQVYIA